MLEAPSITRMSAREALLKRVISADALAVAPAVALFLGMTLYRILLTPTWVGDEGDDGAFFLMSRNVWRHGLPVLDQTGIAQWSKTWSPALSVILSPAALLRMDAAVIVERVAVMVAGALFIVLAYGWMRRECRLSRLWAGISAACLAASYTFVFTASLVQSDVPAAAALIGGIVLLRRGRTPGGFALLVLAALLRPNLFAPLVGAVIWIVFTERRRAVYAWAAVGAVATLALAAVALALGAFHGYLEQFRSSTGNAHGTVQTFVTMTKRVARGGATMPTDTSGYVFPLLVLVAAVGVWRRRLFLEALIAVATVPVLLFYPAGEFSVGRYLLPVIPLLIGAIAAALTSRGALVSAGAALAAAASIAGFLWRYDDLTPSRAAARAEVANRKGAYRWIRSNVPRHARVLAFLDIQTFLYSGHHATAAVGRPTEEPAYFMSVTSRSEEEQIFRRGVFTSYRGRIVFRKGDVSVLRLERRRDVAALQR